MPPSTTAFVLMQGVDVFKSRDEVLPPIARSHPGTFMEALNLINKIKTRFGSDSQTTKECLSLEAWRSQKYTNEQLHWHMIKLFAGEHNDLLEEFGRFYFASMIGPSASATNILSGSDVGDKMTLPEVELSTSFFQSLQPLFPDSPAHTAASLYSSIYGVPTISSARYDSFHSNQAARNGSAGMGPFVRSCPPPHPFASPPSPPSNLKLPFPPTYSMAPPSIPKRVKFTPSLKSTGVGQLDQPYIPNIAPEIKNKILNGPTRNQPFNHIGGRLSSNGPYIHAICGQPFNQRNTVKSHHFGRGKDKEASGCWSRHGKPNIAWDFHPSCHTTAYTPRASAASLATSVQEPLHVKAVPSTLIIPWENIKRTPVPLPENVRDLLVQPRSAIGNQSGRHANQNLHVLASLATELPRVPKGERGHEKLEEPSNVVVAGGQPSDSAVQRNATDDRHNQEENQLGESGLKKVGPRSDGSALTFLKSFHRPRNYSTDNRL